MKQYPCCSYYKSVHLLLEDKNIAKAHVLPFYLTQANNIFKFVKNVELQFD